MTPAETPTECEACKTYLRSEPSHIALNEWLKMFDEHHRIIAEKDARIRELVALIRQLASLVRAYKRADNGRAYELDEKSRPLLKVMKALLEKP